MTHNFSPYIAPRQLTEAEIIQQIRHDIEKFEVGRGIYQTEHIKMILDKLENQAQIIRQQEKDLRHCEKYLNRMIIWKNKFWLSVKRIEHSGYNRKLGLQGKRVLGYSVRLRVLGREVL